ncbi:retrovirus-related pol polyprotein from transposon 17.6 [Tanacetum coccineum]|uniref:Retrovirus-related pol polyprotein from transposon 17.6 n=1 Tax=Tanacetum coccineum TaxID=301880 RepID=A0ABQ5AU22_9ASTR
MSKLVSQTENVQVSSLCCVEQSATLHLMQCSEGQDINLTEELNQLLEEYADVFTMPKELPSYISFDHKIPLKTDNVSINIRPYRYPPTQKNTIETMIKELLDLGIVRPSNSPFSSPIVMVKKKDGSWWMCIDYRHLNKNTVKDKFPIPVIEELIDELHGAMVFSKLDLRKLILVFFDDILVYSPSQHDHIQHLKLVLQTMRDNTLFAKKSKCVFGTTQVEYLGHVISAQGVSTDPSKIIAMQSWPIPSTLKQLRGVLGLTGYYRRFIKGYASISQPLTTLLKKNAFQWSPQAQASFEALKQTMIQSHVLALPNFVEEFVIETDASGIGIGAALQQNKHPVAYLSKALAPKHQSLSTYEKEILAVVLALQK